MPLTRDRLASMHDARALAAMMGLPAAPLCEWVITPLGAPGSALGTWVGGNILDDSWVIDADLPGEWVLAWSGTLGGHLFEGPPANWMRGPGALAATCDALAPQFERHGKRLLLVPHARHVLSDARSALTWWCERVIPGLDPSSVRQPPVGARAFGLALDAGALLEPSMIPDVQDHLQSLFAAFGPRVDAVILRDVRPSDQDADRLIPCAAGEGVLPRDCIRQLVAAHVPATTPLLLPGAALDRSIEWLGVR